MMRIVREMVRAVAALPVTVIVLFGLAILLEIVVVTQWDVLISQWDRLTSKQPPAPALPTVLVPPLQPEQRAFRLPEAQPPGKAQAEAAEAALARRLARFVIVDPKVQGNGSILGGNETLYLYGIKQFDRKKLCTRASGQRWACGLRAYATLRNEVAKKMMVCDPKTLLANAVNATCRIGTINVALVLVRDGLAEVDDNVDDAELVNAQESAKSIKLGIWDR